MTHRHPAHFATRRTHTHSQKIPTVIVRVLGSGCVTTAKPKQRERNSWKFLRNGVGLIEHSELVSMANSIEFRT